jgi:hypothetical protein
VPEKLILKNSQSAGDIVMLTAAVRDLHRCYPGRFLTDVRTSCSDLWIGNPHLTPLQLVRLIELIQLRRFQLVEQLQLLRPGDLRRRTHPPVAAGPEPSEPDAS